jgi:arginyl-tRNA---protein transferase
VDEPPHGDGQEGVDGEMDSECYTFHRGILGTLTKEQLLAQGDLEHIKSRIRYTYADACGLVGWKDRDIDDATSIKGIIAELAAAIVPEVAREMVVTLGRTP